MGESIHDPNDPVGRLLFNVLALVAESDLIRMRTREGMKVAKAKGRLRGKQPKLKPNRQALLVEMYEAGEHTTSKLADLFEVARSTVYRTIQRARVTPAPPTKKTPKQTPAKTIPVRPKKENPDRAKKKTPARVRRA